MLYDVVSIVWTEDPSRCEFYLETRTVEASSVDETYAHELAEELVDAWVSVESGLVKRFINGSDHGAYVEDRYSGKARGIRVTVRSSQ